MTGKSEVPLPRNAPVSVLDKEYLEQVRLPCVRSLAVVVGLLLWCSCSFAGPFVVAGLLCFEGRLCYGNRGRELLAS